MYDILAILLRDFNFLPLPPSPTPPSPRTTTLSGSGARKTARPHVYSAIDCACASVERQHQSRIKGDKSSLEARSIRLTALQLLKFTLHPPSAWAYQLSIRSGENSLKLLHILTISGRPPPPPRPVLHAKSFNHMVPGY